MCELLDLYWDKAKNAGNAEGRSEGRVSMLVSYLQNSNDNPEALANTFKLLGATPAEISEAKKSRINLRRNCNTSLMTQKGDAKKLNRVFSHPPSNIEPFIRSMPV